MSAVTNKSREVILLRNTPTPTLAETQALFQKAVLDSDDEILASLCDNSKTTRTTLFGVYRNAYRGRLVDILAQDYEYLAAYLGSERFAELANAYISAHPSRAQNARWFGAKLPVFLRTLQTHDGNPEYADLAALEKALADAFDAADSASVTLPELTRYPFDDWSRLVFQAHPSARLLPVETDAMTLWKALQTETDLPPLTARLAANLIVWRKGATPMVRSMPDEEAMMWIEAGRGLQFGELCELLATYDDPDNAAARAAGYLQGWLINDMLAGAHLASAN